MVNGDRSYVICHMMSTIDGRIASGVQGVNIFDDFYSLYSQTEHTLKPQAWMCGRVTSEEFAEGVGTPLPAVDKTVSVSDFQSSIKGSAYMIAVDTKGVLRWKSNVLTFGDQSTHHLIIVVTHQTPKEYLSYLQEKDISYIVAGEKDINFSDLLEKLKHMFHIDILALEGGGLLNGSVMDAGLVDENSLLLTPLILNRSSAPTLFERRGDVPVDVKSYQLMEVKKLEIDAIWLRYRRRDK